MNADNKVLLITFVCAIIIFSVGFFAGNNYPYVSPSVCESNLYTCNSLLDYCSVSHNLLPMNCSNPIYKSDNYWYCEVD